MIVSSSLYSAPGTGKHVWRRQYPSSPEPQRLVKQSAGLSVCILRRCISLLSRPFPILRWQLLWRKPSCLGPIQELSMERSQPYTTCFPAARPRSSLCPLFLVMMLNIDHHRSCTHNSLEHCYHREQSNQEDTDVELIQKSRSS